MERFALRSATPSAQIPYQVTPPGGEPGRWLVYTGPFELPEGVLREPLLSGLGAKRVERVLGFEADYKSILRIKMRL